ncbi:Uu.00g093240.m01.CDS01 [Anthostomella pinea]|uniref:Uu.00g093240.m01.CDS01 n=1 Tax=Anthostomella pinea TaxID=933095 RepID=A0AAI8VHZ2_9PEZI|nr:Uu.00g093240.m01.CDS01 [Anthostomella pinea]
MTSFRTALTLLTATPALAHVLPAVSGDVAAAKPCTTGTPVVTAGYTINYALATPTATGTFRNGYQPEPGWAGEHVVGTYTFGVPTPIDAGFAYAQFKCQYYCNSQTSGSFYAKYAGADSRDGSYCHCYDDLLDPDTFVEGNQTLVGTWNSICSGTDMPAKLPEHE